MPRNAARDLNVHELRQGMAEPLADQIMNKIKRATDLYYRLVLVVAPTGGGKTTALQSVRNQTRTRLVNVNLELSRQLLDLTERQRILQLPNLFRTLVNTGSDVTILLDNIKILFDIGLKQDPLRLLQQLSRNKTVVAAWEGSIVGDSLAYAVQTHPEYRRYQIRDFLTVSPEVER